MTNLREAAQMALDALEFETDYDTAITLQKAAIEMLRAALANEFNPDWDQIEALQESLREHMAEIQRLRARLAQPEPEPVAWMYNGNLHEFDPSDWAVNKVTPLYTAPPQRDEAPAKAVEWQGLTDDEQMQVAWSCGAMSADWLDFARAIEAKLKEKNG